MIMKNALASTIFVLILLGAAGCGNSQKDTIPGGDDKAQEQVVTDPKAAEGLGTDKYQLDTATLEGDTLVVTVSYGGGCKEHLFALDASRAFMESDPVQLQVSLRHDAKGDPCQRWVTEDYTFDLSPLETRYQEAYGQDSGTIILQLEGFSEELRFEF